MRWTSKNPRTPPLNRAPLQILLASGLAAVGLLATTPTPTFASQPKPTNVAILLDGTGTLQGTLFQGKQSGRLTPWGKLQGTVNSDPAATRPLGVVDGKFVLSQISAQLFQVGKDQLFGRGEDRLNFELLRGPDGNPILTPEGLPIPDSSKPVAASSELVISGGTGKFAKATGTVHLDGLITATPPVPADPNGSQNFSFRFQGSGKVTLRSTGNTSPVVSAPVSPAVASAASPSPEAIVTTSTTSATPTTTVAPGPAIASLVSRGPTEPGTYVATTKSWKVTLRLGAGWTVNGSGARAIGLSRGANTAPDFTGLLILDDPLTYLEVRNPGSPLISVPADVGAWLASIPGISVDPPRTVKPSSIQGAEFTMRYVPPPEGPARIALYNARDAGPVPFPYGPPADQTGHAVIFERPGAPRLLIGFAGGTGDPRQLFTDIVVAVEPV